MIDRYTSAQMRALWSEENKFKRWLEIEIIVCQAWAEAGKIPKSALRSIERVKSVDIARINQIEKETRHDVIAFLTALAEKVGPDARYIHLGMTSSDLVDTALSTLARDAGKLILVELKNLSRVLKKKAIRYKRKIVIGRTHGVHGEPTTLGLRMARFYAEIERSRERLERAIKTISVAKLSGAVGTYSTIPPSIEAKVAGKLGLTPSDISSQVIPRDRHAEYLAALAILAASIENIAVEARSAQRTEILELQESFGKGQKGSSAMPHKKNPITAENLTGLARLVKGNLFAALENVALWGERDISHSSVERVIFPDSTTLIETMTRRCAELIDRIEVIDANIERNLNMTNGLIFSQKAMLALIDRGLSRDEAYLLIQSASMESWKSSEPLIDILSRDERVAGLIDRAELAKIFRAENYLAHVDAIYNGLFGKSAPRRKRRARDKK